MTIHDGYHIVNFNLLSPDKMEKFKQYVDQQSKINVRLKEISTEISNLPKIPNSIDEWIESWPESNKKKFNIEIYSKHFSIKREYYSLIENSEHNLREIKILTIEDLIEKIQNILDCIA